MSIANLIPALKGTGSRRAVDKVEELRAENGRLLASLHLAGEEIALLRWDLTITSTRQGEAEELVVQLKADVDDLVDERDAWKAEALALRARFGPQIAAEANANRVTVPPMVRDTDDPADQATTPIDVRPLWVALGLGPTAAVTDPGHIPAPPAEPEPAT